MYSPLHFILTAHYGSLKEPPSGVWSYKTFKALQKKSTTLMETTGQPTITLYAVWLHGPDKIEGLDQTVVYFADHDGGTTAFERKLDNQFGQLWRDWNGTQRI